MTTQPIKLLSWIAAALVLILALLAFILSYSSLRHLAASNGIPGWLPYIWPMLLDFAMVVFSLAILRANLRGERAGYPWVLTISFAALATIANVLDVATLGIPPIAIAASVKALAPIALVLAFELLMGMVRAELKRAAIVASITDLNQQQAEAETLKAELSETIADLTAKAEGVKAELSELRAEKKRESSSAPAQTTDATIEQARAILAERGDTVSGAELGRLLGKSESLGRRLRRDLLPTVTMNDNESSTHSSSNGSDRIVNAVIEDGKPGIADILTTAKRGWDKANGRLPTGEVTR